jgi:hypothetical protein
MSPKKSFGVRPWFQRTGVRWSVGALALAALAARFYLVEANILYGVAAISTFDFIVAAIVVSAAALVVLRRSRHTPVSRRESSPGNGDPAPNSEQRWTDWAASIVAVSSISALVISTLVLIQPATPPSLATAPCSGVGVRDSPYIGTTAAEHGVNSRTGPARSYRPNGRFPLGCSMGFSAFCIGEPVIDTTGTTEQATWVTTRWLEVTRQPGGVRSWLAERLSGEVSEARYISDAFITPATRYDQLDVREDGCPGADRYPYPAKAELAPFAAGTLLATSANAGNIGFAMWTPRVSDTVGERYAQIYHPGGKPENNPGSTGGTGEKTVSWDPQEYLASAPAEQVSDKVVVMAVPCLADNIPARSSTAATASYQLAAGEPPTLMSEDLSGFDVDQLARAACQAST